MGLHRMKRWSRSGVALLAALMWSCWLVPPAPAHAHARLLSSTPAPGATLQTAPLAIEIDLSEAVSLDFSSIVLVDRARREVSLGRLGYGSRAESSISVPIADTLPAGTYGVIWRVVSAVDGHVTTGSFVFRVLGEGESSQATPEPVLGAAGPTDAALESTVQRPGVFHWLVRVLVLACITFCLGGAIFLVLVAEPAAGEQGSAGASLWPALCARFARLGAIAASGLVPLLASDLWAQVAAISQADLGDALGRSDTASLLLATTRFGFAWTMKMLAAVVLFCLFQYIWARGNGGSGVWEIAIAAGSLFLLAQSLSSHAAAAQGENVAGLPLPAISDWLHLVTASTWIGGLLFFLLVLFPTFHRGKLERHEWRAFLSAAVPRFSRLALASVLVLGVSGTYNLAIQSTDLPAIAGTLYGQVVALKVVLFLALIAIGAINLAHLSPQLRIFANGQGGSTVSRFRRNIRLEVALMTVVLLCAGGLTLLPPPSDASPQTPGTSADSGGTSLPTASRTGTTSPQPVAAAISVAGISVSLSVEQARAGEVFSVTLVAPPGGNDVLSDVIELVLAVSPQSLEAGRNVMPTRLAEASTAQQRWVAQGSALAIEGDYLVTVVAQRSSAGDLKAAFWLTLAEDRLTLRAIEYIEARISTVPEPTIEGSNRVVVDMRGAEGQPLGDVRAMVSAHGPGGGRVEEVPLTAEPGQVGIYIAQVELSAPGAWSLLVRGARPGQPELRFTASIDVEGRATPLP